MLYVLNLNHSTTQLCYKLLDSKFLDKNGRIKEDYKFKINIPEFNIIHSKIPAKKGGKFDTYLFLPKGKNRKGEGGLRTRGFFKFSYKKFKNEWWVVDFDGNKIKQVEIDKEILKDYEELPLITIVTVVYNGEKYLEDTIQSVINQTYPNVEYIIIDGGSSDGTLDIIKKYENYIDYWVSEKDKGIYDAMNKGITVSLGNIIGTLNSDDIYLSNSLLKVAEFFINQKADIYYGDLNLINDHKEVLKYRKASEKKLLLNMTLNHPATFITRRVYEKKLYNTSYSIAADYEFLLWAKLNEYKFAYIPVVLTLMRDGGVSSIYNRKARKEIRKIKKEMLNGFYFVLSEILNILIKLKSKLR